MLKILSIFLVLASFFVFPVQAQEENPADSAAILPQTDYTALRMTNAAQVDQIIDPLRIRLKNGTIIQLASLDIPDLNPYEPGEYAVAARDFLQELLTDQPIRFYQTKTPNKGRENRMGYALGHIERKSDNTWIQGALLANGLARVLPSTRNLELATEMMALEEEARAENRGLWADLAYAVLTPKTAEKGINGWAIVEGRPQKIATVKNNLYLNFGADWRTDFTIMIAPTARKKLAQNGIDAMNLTGKKIRVRGWMEEYNGPSIKLSHATWLEVLPEADEASTLTP